MIKLIANEAEMRQFGANIASLLHGGEIIELVGDLGSGKTTFVKGLASGLGISEDVQSPTYTLSREYEVNDNLKLVHYDFYRLESPGIMADDIHENAGRPGVITVVEWAGIVQDFLPIDRLTISIVAPTESTRRLLIESHGIKSMGIMKNL